MREERSTSAPCNKKCTTCLETYGSRPASRRRDSVADAATRVGEGCFSWGCALHPKQTRSAGSGGTRTGRRNHSFCHVGPSRVYHVSTASITCQPVLYVNNVSRVDSVRHMSAHVACQQHVTCQPWSRVCRMSTASSCVRPCHVSVACPPRRLQPGSQETDGQRWPEGSRGDSGVTT